jgi:hypothetical protein
MILDFFVCSATGDEEQGTQAVARRGHHPTGLGQQHYGVIGAGGPSQGTGECSTPHFKSYCDCPIQREHPFFQNGPCGRLLADGGRGRGEVELCLRHADAARRAKEASCPAGPTNGVEREPHLFMRHN